MTEDQAAELARRGRRVGEIIRQLRELRELLKHNYSDEATVRVNIYDPENASSVESLLGHLVCMAKAGDIRDLLRDYAERQIIKLEKELEAM